jgi:hypothetical protein
LLLGRLWFRAVGWLRPVGFGHAGRSDSLVAAVVLEFAKEVNSAGVLRIFRHFLFLLPDFFYFSGDSETSLFPDSLFSAFSQPAEAVLFYLGPLGLPSL